VLDPESARECTRARLHLRTAGGAEAGYLEFRAAGASEVESPAATRAVRAGVHPLTRRDIRLEPRRARLILNAAPENVRFSPDSISAATLP